MTAREPLSPRAPVPQPDAPTACRTFGPFVVLAYALAWGWWVPLALTHTTVVAGQGWPTHLIGLLAPSIAAVVASARLGGRAALADLARRCVRWRIDPRAYAIIVATAAAGLVPVLVSGDADWAGFGRYSGAPEWGVATVVLVLFVNGFGEEIGWRGFLWDRSVTRTGFRDSAVMVWAVWGLWHLPLFWVVGDFRSFGALGIAGWVVSLFFGAVFLGWFYEFTGRSILAVVLWHVVYNFSVATDATSGAGAAFVSAGVIFAGVAIMRTGAGFRGAARGVGATHERPSLRHRIPPSGRSGPDRPGLHHRRVQRRP